MTEEPPSVEPDPLSREEATKRVGDLIGVLEEKRLRGNASFRQKDYGSAARIYISAVGIIQLTDPPLEECAPKVAATYSALRRDLHCNLAAALLNSCERSSSERMRAAGGMSRASGVGQLNDMRLCSRALEQATAALSVDSSCVKAAYRAGQSLMGLGWTRRTDAIRMFERCLEIDPGNRASKRALARLQAASGREALHDSFAHGGPDSDDPPRVSGTLGMNRTGALIPER